MQELTAPDVLSDLRIPHTQIATMINEAIESMGDQTIGARLRQERDFYFRASDLTQNLVVAVTLAQTLDQAAAFESMLQGASFSGGDFDLSKLGIHMLSWMVALPREVTADLPEGLFHERVKMIEAAI